MSMLDYLRKSRIDEAVYKVGDEVSLTKDAWDDLGLDATGMKFNKDNKWVINKVESPRSFKIGLKLNAPKGIDVDANEVTPFKG
jgi:hypothetical protein